MFLQSIGGIRASLDLMERAARESQKGVEGDLIQAQVDMIKAGNSLTANISALRTADSMYKSLIDIFA